MTMRHLPLLVLIVVSAALLSAGCDGGKPTDVAVARRAPLEESFTEPGRTRLELIEPIRMPVDALIQVIELKPGDTVSKGQKLVDVDLVPLKSAAMEARTRVAELEKRVALLADESVEQAQVVEAKEMYSAMVAQRDAAAKAVDAQKVRADWSTRENERIGSLRSTSAVSESKADETRRDYEMAVADLARLEGELARINAQLLATAQDPIVKQATLARRSVERQALELQLEQARARLMADEHRLALAHIVAPTDAVILERYERGGGPLAAGTRLFLLGDLNNLEVETDVLTQDAVRLRPGMKVEYSMSPGLEMLTGEVARVEPGAFTKLSSLGVEQQRVLVISTLTSRPESLGLGFRVQSRFITGTRAGALVVPRYSVLQSPDGSYYVLSVRGGTIVRQAVSTGLRNDREMEITDGLNEGDQVVASPDSAMKEGTKISPRLPQ